MTCENDYDEYVENGLVVTIAGGGIGAYGSAVQSLVEDVWKSNPRLFTGVALAKFSVLSAAADILTVSIAVQSGDSGRIGYAASGAIASVALGAIAAATMAGFFAGAPILATMAVVGGAGAFGTWVGQKVWEEFSCPTVNPANQNWFTRGVNWFRPSDPLIFDLDGDGIELTANAGAILFDHDADGIKTGTQWIKADDGILVYDLNANGVIDSGRELFGDQTLLPNGETAANGFAAIAPLDSNADGLITSADVAYAQLRIWRDLNQDGVSQESELQSLDSLDINAINLNANSQGTSSYTRSVVNPDGSTSTVTRTVQNINFATNNFYREFTDDPEVTEAAAALPQMRGAGMVRDLRQAMSLGTPQATALEQIVTAFKAAATAQERQALLDQVINTWSGTSGQPDAVARNTARSATWYNATVGDAIAAYAQAKPAEYAMMSALERFNGQAVLERYVRQRSASYYEPSEQRWKGYTYYVVEIEAPRLELFAQAYQALKSSVYQGMFSQTAGRDLLNMVGLQIDDKGIRQDFSAINAVFAIKIAQSSAAGAVDLAEFIYFAKSSLLGSDWDGAAQLADLLETTQFDSAQSAILSGFNYKFSGALGSTVDANLGGTTDADVVVGRAGNDILSAGSGNDILIGGAGNDQLIGGYGNDQLVGGQGNDYLNGQWGTDTYFWGAGQGNDYIHDGLVNAGEQNTVVLRGLNPTDVSVELVTAEDYRRFRLTLLATGETLTLDTAAANYWEGSTTAPVRLVFADGSQWNMDDIIRQTLSMPTEGDDLIIGTPAGDLEDRLNGGAGDDIIVGREGMDVMEGGVGNDRLYGHALPYYFDADGIRQPTVQSWRYDVSGNADSDVYVFGRGDGQDTIFDLDYRANEDVLRFKEGVSAEDLELAQRGTDLVARIKGSTDQVTIKNFFGRYYDYGSAQPDVTYAIERFDFADGTSWNLSDIRQSSWAGTAQDDVFFGDNGDNLMGGADGDDVIDGNRGDDSLSGGAGDDLLQGGDGNDVLDGGAGNDMLYAGDGADTIRFGRGDGRDVLARDVNNYGYYLSRFTDAPLNPLGNNVVELKEGVGPDDVKLVRNGTTLTLQIKGTSDALTIQDFFVTRYSGDTPLDLNFSLREIRFEDGTRWGPEEMLARTLVGDESNETFSGFESNEVFDGGGGNDQYSGGGGDDVYRFGRSDGQDRVWASWSLNQLVFKDGVSPDDVVVRRVNSAVVFTIRDTGDSITFENAYGWWGSGVRELSMVRFADGSTWTPEQVDQKALEGTDGDDVIADLGVEAGEVLAGGAGNDVLIGQRGGGTIYVFNRGDGQDIVDEGGSYSYTDTLRFGPDIVATDLEVRAQGDDLVIGIAGTNDRVTIKNHASSVIETYEVGGITLSHQEILALAPNYGEEIIYGSAGDDNLAGSDRDSTIYGYGGGDELAGNGGSDTLFGSDGDDVLSGGLGRDQLHGGGGSNIYRYNRGDGLDRVVLTPGASDAIELGEGIAPADVSVQLGSASTWIGNQYVTLKTMVIGFGGNDALLLEMPDSGTGFEAALQPSNTLRFSDGSALSLADLLAQADDGVVGGNWGYGDGVVLRGSQADDYINEDGGADVYLEGRDNNDQLQAYGLRAKLDGGDGEDRLSADRGGALMAGGRGNDQVYARSWGEANTIAFNLGDGKDLVEGGGSTPGVLSLGVGINPADLWMHVDGRGDLVIRIADSEGDEIRTHWYESDLQTPNYYRGFDKIQFIDAEGKVRLFDLTRLDTPEGVTTLSTPAVGLGLDVLNQLPSLEVTEFAPVHGGEAAIAYAQSGDMRAGAYIAANADLSGNNILFGTPDEDVLDGGDGDDVVMGADGDDILLGGAGDDLLEGGAGNDTLDGGTGRNKAMGGDGDDTYHYARGNGFLYIDDGVSFDGGEGGYGGGSDYNRLVFGEGITLEDLVFERDGNDLKVTVAGASGDTVVMAGFDEYLDNRNRSIDEFVFQDGSSVALQDLWGEDADSYLVQSGDGDLTGTDLRDELRGGLGDDRLEGGAGNDRLEGGAGNDAYVLGYDSGNDVIVDSAADENIIVVSDWSVTRDDVSLQTEDGEVGLLIGSRFVSLEGWDGQDLAQAPIRSLIFADGSSLSMADLFNRPRFIEGTPQDDVLQGGAAADVILGLAGNDLMEGGGGADTYIVDADSGADTITDTSAPGEENTLLFVDGTAPEDIRLTLDADRNLVLQWADGSQVTLTEFDYLDPLDKTSIAYFQFGADGPVWSYQELLARGFEIEGTEQNDVLFTTALQDVVRAGDGDDVILGSTGGDNLHGGGGNDLYEYRLGDGWVGITDVADGTGANVVRFGEGITAEMLERKLRFNYFSDEPEGNSLRIVFDEDNVLQLNGFDPFDPQGSPHAVEYFEFADGTVLSWDQLLDKIFVVEGDATEDWSEGLRGTSRSDRLYGYGGDDVLEGYAGDDVLTGGTGGDQLNGGAGVDNYVFNLGDGEDEIFETGADGNIITFGEGVFEADITVERDGADFVIRYGSLGDTIRISSADGVNTPLGVVDRFELADGTLIPFAQFTNHAPEVGDLLQDQQGRVGEGLDFEFSGGAFTDADGSELSYRAQLSNGQPLPDWLSFNPQTRTFSGMPPLEAVGSYEIAVFAVDPSGAAMQQIFSLAVDGLPNHAPEAMTDQAEVQEDLLIEATGNVLANDLDVDADTVLTVSNAGTLTGLWGTLELQADGSYVYRLDNSNPHIQALGQGQSESDVFTYTVTDGTEAATSQLIVTIAGTNDAPVLSADLGEVQEDGVVEVAGSVLANDTDIDGDSLTVSDPGTYVGAYGTLTLLADGSYRYVLDNGGDAVQGLQAGVVVMEEFVFHVTDGSVSTVASLSISVMGSNDGPLVFADTASVVEDAQPTVDGNVLANDLDGDAGGVLQVGNAGVLQGQYGTLTLELDGSYSYTLYNDALVQSLAAGQGVTDVFHYSATDGSDTSTTTLTVTVTGENDAPIIVTTLGDQTGREGQAFNFVLPESMALDVDQGDVLSYAVSLASGDPLPAWLGFDPASRMLSGTPGESDAGVFALRVTVTDSSGASVSSVFDLSVEDGVCTVGGVFNGTARSDVINGTECADVINGLDGNDQLYGQGGNDVLNGGKGTDFVSGGAGNDTLQMSIDAVWGSGSVTKQKGSPGLAGSGVRIGLKGMNRSLDVLDGGSAWDTLLGTSGDDALILDAGSGNQPQLRDIEQFELGAGNDVLDLTSTRFSYGNVVVNAGSGKDTIWSSGGNDRLYGGAGSDTIDAGAGNDFVDGGDHDDRLISLLGYGDDIVRGGAGNDLVTELSGQNLLDGGVGNDTLTDGNGNSVLAGGKGNDVLKLGRGKDILLFNRGDGKDTVIGGSEYVANDTLVLGGGIRYEDLSFKRDNDDLLLIINQDGCATDQIRFADWYEGHRTISRLEIAIDASNAYQGSSANMLLNKRNQSFDFEGLVEKFNADSDGGCGPHGSHHSQAWSLSASLMQFHLGGSDTSIMGGDMAHYYAHQGTLNGLSLGVAQATLSQSTLGRVQQEISPLNVQASGAVRL